MRETASRKVSAGISGSVPTYAVQTTIGASFGLVQIREDEELVTSSFVDHVLCIQLRDANAEVWTNEKHLLSGRLYRGTWMAHEPGSGFRSVTRSAVELLRLVVPSRVLLEAAERHDLDGHTIRFIDSHARPALSLLQIAEEMRRLLAYETPSARLYVDSLAQTFLGHLIYHHSTITPPKEKRCSGLAKWQERRTIEHLVAHLSEDVTLDALAEVAHLSTYHFARQFRQSTGMPPHAYQRRLRCDKAKDLLVSTQLSIAQIALELGYQTQQAFSRMFRAEVGTSPSEYRRERKA